ncbi:peptidase [Pedobacter psychrophilus]|uniref:Peptidase n=1 Tax=Pedobacter psychrophilus TaxID=1826909 RepID=A0A179DBD9_9SPHI|nr:zinc-dependent metalloprotease [Pedobacter psychrophilus]OAQ38234.1 peptidase [Pedobacter psychrophilus]
MRKIIYLLFIGLFIQTVPIQAQNIENKTKEFTKYPGYFNFYWDDSSGKIYLEIDKFNQEFLYVTSLPFGVGSNDLGLDRGQIGGNKILKFVKIGPKVLLQQPNYDYRAITNNIDEKNSVEQAFASSVIFGFKAEAMDGDKVLIDLTPFLMRDVHQIGDKLAAMGQGSYKTDESRSAIYLENTKNFPKNTEFESIITLTGTAKGREIRSVTPDPDNVTVHTHQSFIELPDSNYQFRKFDPRAGFYNLDFMDYATPIDQNIVKKLMVRHRLQKKDPSAAVSEAVNSIVYYIDRGAPEPIRSALMDGAKWWNQAFEAAGYKDAFQVKLLPEGVDPMDIRYNLVQWVHRSTRGWSYGESITDPRTGEIIKGQVSLGSLRVRQDYLIATGLLLPYGDEKQQEDQMMKMSLARIRQLAAHEIGHTLGIQHNFAASTNNRASVMDYPFPHIKMDAKGNIDLSDTYAVGIGSWDKRAVLYGYQDFPKQTNEEEALNNIFKETLKQGFSFISDADSRPESSAHPAAHLWDDGKDPIATLDTLMNIRKTILNKFSDKAIKTGMPMATIEEALVPIYLLHRYQIEAVSKIVGGLNYTFALKGDGQLVTSFVNPQVQQQAFDKLLSVISPDNLILPESLIANIPPRPIGYPRSRETFKTNTGLTFDALSPAESLTGTTLNFLLNPERLERIIEHHARDNKQPSLEGMLGQLINQTFKSSYISQDNLKGEIARMVQVLTVNQILNTLGANRTSENVKARLLSAINDIKGICNIRLTGINAGTSQLILNRIKRFEEHPEDFKLPEPIAMPDGSPIGDDEF